MVTTNDESSGTRQLRMLELRLAELTAKGFTATHPDVIKIRAELEGVAANVARAQGRGGAGRSSRGAGGRGGAGRRPGLR